MTNLEFNRSAIRAGNCVSGAWKVVTGNLATYLAVILFIVAIYIVIAVINAFIPVLSIFLTIANVLFMAVLAGGIYYIAIQDVDREPSDFGMIFTGFAKAGPLLLAGFIEAIPSVAFAVLQFTGYFANLFGLGSLGPPRAALYQSQSGVVP